MDLIPKIHSISSPIRKPLAIFSTLGLILAYYAVVMSHAVNIPHWDEYIITLGFLDRFDKTGSTLEAIRLLFSQANEHRISLYRLLLLAERQLFGDVNFIRMIALGNLGVLFFWGILWQSFPKMKDKLYYFLPVTFLLFVPAWERSQWACSSFFNTYANLFAFAALYFLNKEGSRYFIIAATCSILATFSFGNGILVYPVGLGLLWLKKKNKNRFWIWGGLMLAIIVLYFLGYHLERTSIPTSFLFTNPILFAAYIFSFFGAVLKYFSPYIAPFAGVSIFLWFFALALKGKESIKQYPLAWSYLLFLLLSVGAVAVTRSGFGLAQALTTRYELIPAGFVAILYLMTFQFWEDKLKIQFGLIILFSVALYAARMDANYEHISKFRERLESGMLLYCANDYSALSTGPTAKKEMANLLKRSELMGNYRIPYETLLEIPIQQTIEKPEKNREIQSYLTIEADSDELYYAKGWAFIKGLDTHDLHIYFVLKSENGQIFAFKCDSHIRKDVTQNYGHGLHLHKSGFNIVLPKKKLEIPPGSYKAGLYLKKGTVRSLHYLGTSILIP